MIFSTVLCDIKNLFVDNVLHFATSNFQLIVLYLFYFIPIDTYFVYKVSKNLDFIVSILGNN